MAFREHGVLTTPLRVGQKIIGTDGQHKILHIEVVFDKINVYNITVDKYHNYIANGLIVHNALVPVPILK